MATPLKDFFNERLVRRIAGTMSPVYPAFPVERFVAEATKGLSDLELLGRGKHIAAALANALPTEYEEAVDVLLRSLNVPAAHDAVAMASFFYLPHVTFVAERGLDHFDVSMRAQHALTQKFTAEFSIRHFLLRHPAKTLNVLRKWARDGNVHVRRLVSEGTRPRLPWAVRLPAFIKDPAPVLALIEQLRDDPELYVRRSVANSLNDIAKNHPDIVVDVCKRWKIGATPERKKIISHALRWLVKCGHPGALAIMGAGIRPNVRIENITVDPAQAMIGSAVTLAFDLTSESSKTQKLVVDYVVHHPGSSGKIRSKVWKLRNIELPAHSKERLLARVSLVDRTIRKHHPGTYRVDLRISGVDMPLGSFEVVAAASAPSRRTKASRSSS